MGFSEKDTTEARTVSRAVEGVTFKRQTPVAAVAAKEAVIDPETNEVITPAVEAVIEVPPVHVMVEVIEDGISVVKRIPAETVVAGWPGTKKTLKAHLLAIADIALGME